MAEPAQEMEHNQQTIFNLQNLILAANTNISNIEAKMSFFDLTVTEARNSYNTIYQELLTNPNANFQTVTAEKKKYDQRMKNLDRASKFFNDTTNDLTRSNNEIIENSITLADVVNNISNLIPPTRDFKTINSYNLLMRRTNTLMRRINKTILRANSSARIFDRIINNAKLKKFTLEDGTVLKQGDGLQGQEVDRLERNFLQRNQEAEFQVPILDFLDLNNIGPVDFVTPEQILQDVNVKIEPGQGGEGDDESDI